MRKIERFDLNYLVQRCFTIALISFNFKLEFLSPPLYFWMDFCFFTDGFLFLLPRDIRTYTQREREKMRQSWALSVTWLDLTLKGKRKKRFIGRRRGLIHLGNRMSYFPSLSPYPCTCIYFVNIYRISII